VKFQLVHVGNTLIQFERLMKICYNSYILHSQSSVIKNDKPFKSSQVKLDFEVFMIRIT